MLRGVIGQSGADPTPATPGLRPHWLGRPQQADGGGQDKSSEPCWQHQLRDARECMPVNNVSLS